jgi:hypothetical protein
MLLQTPANEADNYSQQHAEDDHSSDGKIKTEVLFFYANVARQVADPMQFIVKEIDNYSYYHHGAANEYKILAGIGIHKKIILITLQCFHR